MLSCVREFLWLVMVGFILIPTYGQYTYQCLIIDELGQPLAGTHIHLGQKVEITGRSGLASFSDIQRGSHALEISSLGYRTIQSEVDLSHDRLDTFVLENQIYQIETIELNASWIKPKQPFTHQTIYKTELEKTNVGQDVPFLLRWMPSTVVTSDAGTGIGYTGIRLRGSDPTRINVTLDGVPINDSESQGVFWVDLPDLATTADAIQVQRGVGTSTNGAGAFGGTINVRTKAHRPQAFATMDLSAGSFDTYRGNLQFGTGTLGGKFGLDGRLSLLTSNGYIDRGSADLSSLQLNARYFTDKQNTKLSLYDGKEITYQAWNGVPQQYINDEELRTYNTAGQRKNGFHPDEVDNYRQTHLHFIHKRHLSTDLLLNTTLHYTKGQGYFEQYRIEDPLSSYGINPIELNDTIIESSDLIRRRWLDNDFFGAIASISKQAKEGSIEWSLGGGYNRYLGGHFGEVIWSRYAGQSELGARYYDNDATKSDGNLYGQLQVSLPHDLEGFIDLQWRNVQYSFVGLDANLLPVDQKVTHDFFNPKIGLTYNLPRAQLYYSVGVANREPNRNDYVDSSPQSRPRAERLTDHELGIRYQTKGMSLNANLYYMQYRDQLALTGKINDVGEYTRVNIPKSYRLGAEMSLDWILNTRFQVLMHWAVSQNRVQSFEEAIDDWDNGGQVLVQHQSTPLAFSPGVVSTSGFSYFIFRNDQSELDLRLLHKYVGKQYLDNTGNEFSVLDAYNFADLHLRWQLKFAKRSLQVRLLLRNLFDQKVISNGWIYRYQSLGYDATADDPHAAAEGDGRFNLTGLYPQAGRNLLLGLTLDI